tara:strand:+ start:54 stop:566 length:513 start_codon:yes stop_codon:yes gene_type:complete
MKVHKDFIKKKEADKINDVLLRPYFPWHYNKHQARKGDTSYMFHLFYGADGVNSDYFYLVEPILKKLKGGKLLNVRANLTFKRPSKCFWHVDDFRRRYANGPSKVFKHQTAIYYVNTNNGGTIFKNFKNKKVKSEKNKIVIFDGHQRHKAQIQTNTDARLVININYENKN